MIESILSFFQKDIQWSNRSLRSLKKINRDRTNLSITKTLDSILTVFSPLYAKRSNRSRQSSISSKDQQDWFACVNLLKRSNWSFDHKNDRFGRKTYDRIPITYWCISAAATLSVLKASTMTLTASKMAGEEPGPRRCSGGGVGSIGRLELHMLGVSGGRCADTTTLGQATLRRTTQSWTTLGRMRHYAKRHNPEWDIMPNDIIPNGITPNAT